MAIDLRSGKSPGNPGIARIHGRTAGLVDWSGRRTAQGGTRRPVHRRTRPESVNQKISSPRTRIFKAFPNLTPRIPTPNGIPRPVWACSSIRAYPRRRGGPEIRLRLQDPYRGTAGGQADQARRSSVCRTGAGQIAAIVRILGTYSCLPASKAMG